MSDLLDLFVERADDLTAKSWVAKALLLGFPEPLAEQELTHARAMLAPLHQELVARAAAVEGKRINMYGRREKEPFLAVAVAVAETRLLPRLQGYSARWQLFRGLVELLAAEPRKAAHDTTALLAVALRVELDDLLDNATAKIALPDFESVADLVRWFGREENTASRFRDHFRTAWKQSIGPRLRLALLCPIPPPGVIFEGDDEQGVIVAMPYEPRVEPALLPVLGLIPPEAEGHAERSRSRGTQETVTKASLSTLTPLSRFSTSSTTHLSDADIKSHVDRQLQRVDRAFKDGQILVASSCLARLLVLATATHGAHVSLVRWEGSGRLTGHQTSFPGTMSMDGEWLHRPELRPNPKAPMHDGKGAGSVPIPIPRLLGELLCRLHGDPVSGALVFPLLAESGGSPNVGESAEGVTLTALQRALVTRLMRSEPLGITAAQLTAGDGFGIDLAPLFYDRIDAVQLALKIERITFSWFGERSGKSRQELPSHRLGSTRIPDLDKVCAFHASLRIPLPEALADDIAYRLRRRMRNAVHGLTAASGHRPNNGFTRIRIGDIGFEDLVAVIADKATGPDWQVRPIAVPEPLRDELLSLVAELHEAAATYCDQKLGDMARAALDGTGSFFLDIRGPDDVTAFGIQAYREGLPEELLRVDNFARQLLNSRLTAAVVEPLRVAQMGWHGTRAGAWADGSPWSVLTAARALEKPLRQVLKDAGWRSLPTVSMLGHGPRAGVLDWVSYEKEHRRAFKTALLSAQKAMAKRHGKIAKTLLPKLGDYLQQFHNQLELNSNGQITFRISSDRDEVEITTKDHDRMLSAMSGGDPRSVQAKVARNLLSALVLRARKMGVVKGPIPRRVSWHWPSAPGVFAHGAPRALRDARMMDEALCCAPDATEAARAASALLLHGGYAEVDVVLAAMAPGARLRWLDDYGALLVEPPGTDADFGGESEEDPWSRGCLVFHGLAAAHVWRWHREVNPLPNEAEIDQDIYRLLPLEIRPKKAEGVLREVAALARACNSLRMDGVARPIGTGVVQPVFAELDRVAAARSGNVIASDRRRGEFFISVEGWQKVAAAQSSSPRSLPRQLMAALNVAVKAVDRDSNDDVRARARLKRRLEKWRQGIHEQTPAGLLVCFALALLERGGARRRELKLRTIQQYVNSLGAPLLRYLPDRPMEASALEWEAAYLSVVAATCASHRYARARALHRFHWTLSQEIELPAVSFTDVYALCGGKRTMAEPGFLTAREFKELAAMLEADIKALEESGADARALHVAVAGQLAAHLQVESALRPGEIERLQFRNVARRSSTVDVVKSSLQRLKTINSRRSAQLLRVEKSDANRLLGAWLASGEARLGQDFNTTGPVFHDLVDGKSRLNASTLSSRVSFLVRWATGQTSAHQYWLRKTGVRNRLEFLQATVPLSLWPLRDMLADIGHGDVHTTLAWYTHDPVTPFIRWFQTGLDGITVERLSHAVGRSKSKVARKHDGVRLTKDWRGASARIALLLDAIPTETTIEAKLEAPPRISAPERGVYPLRELNAILMAVAAGEKPGIAAEHWRWPRQLGSRIGDVLTVLEAEYKVAIADSVTINPQRLLVKMPRQLMADGGIGALMDEPYGWRVLATMGEAWLRMARMPGAPAGIAGTAGDWSGWEAQLPQLKCIVWKEGEFGALLVRTPDVPKGGRVSPWALLRWLVITAWIYARIFGWQANKHAHLQSSATPL